MKNKNTTDIKHHRQLSIAARNLNISLQLGSKHQYKRGKQWCTRSVRAEYGVQCSFLTVLLFLKEQAE